MESVRSADQADLARISGLWGEAEAELGAQRGGRLLIGGIVRPAHLADLLDRESGLLAVGCIDEVVVGFISARIDDRPALPVAVVDVAYVEREARAIGVGEVMMDHVVAWADRRGCCGIDAFALPGNRSSKAFFEDNGFVARLLTMHRPLPAAAGGSTPLPPETPTDHG